MTKNLVIYCALLEQLAAPWMLEAANKQLEDILNPTNRRKILEDQAAKLWSRYCSLFDAHQFLAAAPIYGDYLETKANLAALQPI